MDVRQAYKYRHNLQRELVARRIANKQDRMEIGRRRYCTSALFSDVSHFVITMCLRSKFNSAFGTGSNVGLGDE